MDTFADLHKSYALSREQIDSYRKNGHIKLEKVATPEELAPYREEIRREVGLTHKDALPLSQRDTYGKAFLQTTGLWKKNERIKRFVTARRFAKIAAGLMGVDGVRIYQDQALFKEPGGGRTPWHQDQLYWPLDTDKTITMWMPLVDLPVESGAMSFVSGSHQLIYVDKTEISDASDEFFHEFIKDNGLAVETCSALKAGDATFHAGWTIHCAPDNPTPVPREVMTVIYFADQTRVLEPDTKARQEGLKICLSGLKPGDIADGPGNPLVYSRSWESGGAFH